MKVIYEYPVSNPNSGWNWVRTCIDRWAAILPRWVETVDVKVREDYQHPCLAEVHVDQRYRCLTLHLSALLLGEPPEDQEHVIVHELCHSFTTPTKAAFMDAMGQVFDEEAPGKKVMCEWGNQVHEGSTEDLACMLIRLLRPHLLEQRA